MIDEDENDKLLDRMELIAQRDSLDWDRHRGLIQDRAWRELESEKGKTVDHRGS